MRRILVVDDAVVNECLAEARSCFSDVVQSNSRRNILLSTGAGCPTARRHWRLTQIIRHPSRRDRGRAR